MLGRGAYDVILNPEPRHTFARSGLHPEDRTTFKVNTVRQRKGAVVFFEFESGPIAKLE